MDRPIRSFAKAATWQTAGVAVMTAITWAATGSLATGGAVALSGAASGALLYIIHERIWARVPWGLQDGAPAQTVRAAPAQERRDP